MTLIRAALYLDFDNVFSGLTRLDPEAAVSFAQNPALWLDQLVDELTVEGPRRWLILRCYMNPAGWVPHPSTSQRLRFSQFRDSLTRAGFEVIDCPRLTHTKNAADIRLVVDALDALSGPVPYDEFIVASGDSDMTPLLVRLRAADRRVTLLSPFDAVEALAAVADRLINGQQLLELLQDDAEDQAAPRPSDTSESERRGVGAAERDTFGEIVRRRYEAAGAPLNLSALAQDVRLEMASDLKSNGWFGERSFASAIEKLGLPGMQMGTHHLWDTRRHEPPAPAAGIPGPAPTDLPTALARVAGPLGVPRLASAVWPSVADVLARYASSHHFRMTEATMWARDRLEESGLSIGRAAVGFAVRAAAYGGRPLYQDPAPTGQEILEAIITNVLNRAEAAELELTADEVEAVRDWFRGGANSA